MKSSYTVQYTCLFKRISACEDKKSNKEGWEIKAHHFTSLEYLSTYSIFNSSDHLPSVWSIWRMLFVWPCCLEIISKWQQKAQHDTQYASPSLPHLEENKINKEWSHISQNITFKERKNKTVTFYVSLESSIYKKIHVTSTHDYFTFL